MEIGEIGKGLEQWSIAAVIFYFYHQREKRIMEICADFRAIVQGNTAILAKLAEKVDQLGRGE